MIFYTHPISRCVDKATLAGSGKAFSSGKELIPMRDRVVPVRGNVRKAVGEISL